MQLNLNKWSTCTDTKSSAYTNPMGYPKHFELQQTRNYIGKYIYFLSSNLQKSS